jgi:hypothetical protein
MLKILLTVRKKRKIIPIAIGLSLVSVIVGGGLWLNHPSSTIKGVPVSIVLMTLGDQTAREALLDRNKTALHHRLNQLGVEEQIKAFYRPQIQDEAELDRHIHQLFYNNIGYVGQAYYVDGAGILHYRIPPDNSFRKWFKLAYAAGVVIGSKQENGIQYVISPNGDVAPFKDIESVFPADMLEQMIRVKTQSNVAK